MRKTDKPIAIGVSDIHLTLTAPRARKEKDWLKAQSKPLIRLQELKEEYDVPIFCSGDIFDYWKAEPELINFALEFLPKMWAIPGQHDLPYHNMKLLKKSAFLTLVLAGRIGHVEGRLHLKNNIMLHAFPWGKKITPNKLEPSWKHIALCHDYFWIGDHKYPTASKEQHASAFKKNIKGYHSVIFGDNHKRFITTVNGIKVANCGTFMRRRIDEVDYDPRVVLIYKSGDIKSYSLKVKEVIYTEEEEAVKETLIQKGYYEFIKDLENLSDESFNFTETLKRAVRKAPEEVRKIIIEVLEGGTK